MRYLDLFSGIGGFASGIQRAYDNITQPSLWGAKEGRNGTTYEQEGKFHTGHSSAFGKHYFSEIDKYATSVYKRHFPDAVGLGSIVNVDPGKLGRVDLVTFGFPCQDLSIAGNRKGIGGARSGLFFEAIRLIKELKPSVFVFENVKGLFSSGEGRDFVEVLRTISDIGLYECEWQLLNTRWVLPQNRERVYFIGHLRERGRQKVFPIREKCTENNELQGQELIDNSLQAGNRCSQESFIIENQQLAQTGKNSQAYRVRGIENVSTTLAGGAGGVGGKTGLYMVNLHQKRTGEYGNGEKEHENFTVDSSSGRDLCIADKKSIRRLTPTECERLQGFPDGWTECGYDGKKISDNQRYKMLGNAVTVNIVEMVFNRLLQLTM